MDINSLSPPPEKKKKKYVQNQVSSDGSYLRWDLLWIENFVVNHLPLVAKKSQYAINIYKLLL